jgi:hypothetical protein
MQFAIGVTVLECSFVKHSHGPLGVNIADNFSYYGQTLEAKTPKKCCHIDVLEAIGL